MNRPASSTCTRGTRRTRSRSGSRQSWDEAYEWAMGKEVTLSTIATNNKIKKSTPYDFVAITDHAEYFGVMPRLIDPKDPLSKTALGKRLQAKDPTAVTDHSPLDPDEHRDAGVRQARDCSRRTGSATSRSPTSTTIRASSRR